MDGNQYYVCNKRDIRAGWMDGCIVWWKAEGNGYTYDLNHAGIFTDEDRAKGYPSEKNGCLYIPKELVDAHTQSPRLAWWDAAYKSCGCILDAMTQAEGRNA